MKEYSTNDTPLPSANEPEAAYARLSPEHCPMACSQTEEFHKGSMSVDEFCNILHRMVDEYEEKEEDVKVIVR